MKRLTSFFFAVFLIVCAAVSAQDKPGLLILTHGSPSPKWNETIAKLSERVSALNETDEKFHAITAANMEFAKPDAADGVETLQKAGCTRIIVVPAFIMPTGHTHFDVPASLGMYSSPSIRKTMRAENVKPAAPKVPLTITETISEGDVLDKYVKDEVATLSEKPEEEAVLLISHGDEEHSGLVEPVMRRLLAAACGGKGITVGDWAFCEVGQSYMRSVVPVIKSMAKEKKRVLVVGFYLVSSAKSIDKSGTAMGAMGSRRGTSGESKPPLDGIDVRFSEHGVIEHPATAAWVLQSAADAL
ncbi:MAG: CbiX/SirB N-terminal domain-containing protein [Planctomycetaceae bacterium]|jgi:hypothetical protein|nr:CbiX/SirB N-terminal domain-containing protein [Planctomycetaceae bacterium]